MVDLRQLRRSLRVVPLVVSEASGELLSYRYNVYLAGPMRGHPEFNYPAFNSLEAWIIVHGMPVGSNSGRPAEVFNPASNFNGDTTREFSEYMRADIPMLAKCQGIVLLPGWQDSEGARLEVEIGKALALDFFEAVGPRRTFRVNGHDRPAGWKVAPIDTPTHGYTPSASPWVAAIDEVAARLDRPLPEGSPALADHDHSKCEAIVAESASLVDDGRTTTFSSGATRDTSVGKLDYEGFYSPLVMERFAQYMDKNRLQSNGTYRDSDNWQAGFARLSYMKSLLRHVMDVWHAHRDTGHERADIEEALCAVIFNAQGYLLELLLERDL